MSSVIISLCKKPSLVLGNNFAEDTGLTRAPDDSTMKAKWKKIAPKNNNHTAILCIS